MEPAAAARPLVIVVSALVGLAIGSFLNVVVYRLPRRMSLARPASHCPSCHTELSPADNVPVVSWLVLRGRCRYCSAPISIRYPTVEVVTAALFAGCAAALGSLAPLAPVVVVVAVTVAATAIDVDRVSVPRALAAVAVVGAAALVPVSVVSGGDGRLGWAAAGAALTIVACRVWAGRRPTSGDDPVALALVGGALGWTTGWLWPPAGLLAASLFAAATLLRWAMPRAEVPLVALTGATVALLLGAAAVGSW